MTKLAWCAGLLYLFLIPGVPLFVWNKHKKSDEALVTVLWKGSCTTAIVLAALAGLAGTQVPPWQALLVSGLVFGLVGDIVICRSDGFAAGMVLFALGHLCYITGFLLLGVSPLRALPVFAIVYAVALIAACRLRPRLGGLFFPVLAYAAVITAMLSLAAAAAFSFERGWVMLLAAALFLVSDFLLITGKKDGSSQRDLLLLTGKGHESLWRDLFGQYCYFFGQSLFAMSLYLNIG